MDPASINSKNLKDYGIYDKDVIAPISGTIVAAYDAENDIPPNTEDFLSMEGNHVYIKIDKTGTFLLLNHLKKGSVPVKVGDHVKEGQIIGKVGTLVLHLSLICIFITNVKIPQKLFIQPLQKDYPFISEV